MKHPLVETLTVAGIDPGGTTGLVIAKMHMDDCKITLHPLLMESIKNPHHVLHLIRRNQVSAVALEQRARITDSHHGVVPYDVILNGLENLGFDRTKHTSFGERKIATVLPGIWKPVMKTQHLTVVGEITPFTVHEKDALNLLHYCLRINYPRKEVTYE